MFKKILFPTDFSVSDQKLIRCIRELPGVRDVVLFHIVDAMNRSIIDSSYGPAIENAKILMAENKEFLENLGITVSAILDVKVHAGEGGDISTDILDTAEREKASLILLGVREKNLIQSLFLGSISSDVLQRAKTNVLILHGDPVRDRQKTAGETYCAGMFSKVLVPTDFSLPAGEALSFVTAIPGIREIVLLHVVTRGEMKEETAGIVRESHRRLEELSGDLAGAGFLITHHVRVGNPTEMILSVGEEDDVSLIAMSPHGKRWFEDMVMGSTAFAVAGSARRPVLIIREKCCPDVSPDRIT